MSRSASISQSLLTFSECIGNDLTLPPLVVGETGSARVTAANTVSHSSTHRRVLVTRELAGPVWGLGGAVVNVCTPCLGTDKDVLSFSLDDFSESLVVTS